MQCNYKDVSTTIVKEKNWYIKRYTKKDITSVTIWLYWYDTKYTLKPGKLPDIKMDITTQQRE